MSERIEQHREMLVYENSFIRVFDDEVIFPDGSPGTYVRIAPKPDGPAVVIVARHRGRLAQVRVFRYPAGVESWEFPRGFAQGPDLGATVRGELAEELGATASSTTVLGYVRPDSGLLTTRAAVVLVDIATVGTRTDTVEVGDVRWVTPAELEAAISTGEIEDGFTLAAYLRYLLTQPDAEGSPAN